jgi:hypothetical protein
MKRYFIFQKIAVVCALAPLVIGSANATQIHNQTDLENIAGNLSDDYTLMNDINLTLTGSGWTPLGDLSTPFTGTFDGGGHTIGGLWANTSNDYVGLFGVIKNAQVKNLIVEIDNANGIDAGSEVGGIAGYIYGSGSIINSAVIGGSITGVAELGGIAGWIDDGVNITNSYSTVNVSGEQNFIGGIVGNAEGDSLITKTYATGAISGRSSIGGIVGYSEGNISNNTAINPSITGASGGYSYRNRVVGWVAGYSQDNDAREDMSVRPSPSQGDAGTPKPLADFYIQKTYTDLGWSFGTTDAAPWKINNATSPYPVFYWQ